MAFCESLCRPACCLLLLTAYYRTIGKISFTGPQGHGARPSPSFWVAAKQFNIRPAFGCFRPCSQAVASVSAPRLAGGGGHPWTTTYSSLPATGGSTLALCGERRTGVGPSVGRAPANYCREVYLLRGAPNLRLDEWTRY